MRANWIKRPKKLFANALCFYLEIGQPINSEQRSETADGVARESEGRSRLRPKPARQSSTLPIVEKGATHMEAALAVGVHRGTVSRWCEAFRRNGASGIEKGKRGRRVGDQLMLTEVEARRVQGWIGNKCPDQMQLPFALWTAQAVRELIHKKFGKSLGLSTMQLYLKRWGFSAQNL